MNHPEQLPDKQAIWTGKYIRLVLRGAWEFVERVNLSGIVGIIPITDEGKLVLVEQFRVPVGAAVIELPAGLVGDVRGNEEEAMETAARRELIEETGYDPARLVRLYEGAPSAGLSNEHITIFLAGGLRKVGPGGGDHTEDIVVHEVAGPELPGWLEARRAEGKVIDIKVYLALPYCH